MPVAPYRRTTEAPQAEAVAHACAARKSGAVSHAMAAPALLAVVSGGRLAAALGLPERPDLAGRLARSPRLRGRVSRLAALRLQLGDTADPSVSPAWAWLDIHTPAILARAALLLGLAAALAGSGPAIRKADWRALPVAVDDALMAAALALRGAAPPAEGIDLAAAAAGRCDLQALGAALVAAWSARFDKGAALIRAALPPATRWPGPIPPEPVLDTLVAAALAAAREPAS
ncbi:MAG: hypothetical protein ACOYOJ_11430 [Alsobacter sp.]